MNHPTPRRLSNLLSILAVLAGLTACGGGDGPRNTPPPPPPPPVPPPFAPVFSEIQANVLTPNCATAGCHVGAGAPEGLQLDAANSFALLVGVASSQMPAVLRVAPNDPDNSYLIQKLEGTAPGDQMPRGRAPLPQATIDVVRQWITDGATDDRAPSTDPIRVSSLSVTPDAVLAAGPAEIIAGFDRDPDASTVNANTFLLTASGGDGTFNDGNETAVNAASITVPAANTRTAVFDLGGAALADDLYRIQLLGDGPSIIMDMEANALDGEFGGALPSGDGTAGGDFTAEFTVEAPATLDQIQAAVFDNCRVCHSGPTGNVLPAGMDLSDADASFASLVGVASLQQPGIMRVAANDPDNSYLIQKLEGTAASGNRMPPPPNGALPANVIADIRGWIAAGAER